MNINLTRLATASLLIAIVAAPAFAANAKSSPVGAWQSSDGQAIVRVTMCGDGTALCAKLTDVAGTARTPENVQLLNNYVVQQAQMTDTNVWAGTLHFNGETAKGQITLVSQNSIEVSACQMGMCKTMEFRRVGSKIDATVADASAAQMPPRTVGLTVPE